MSFLIKPIIKITIFLLWFASIYDPVGHLFGIRYIALILFLLCLLILVINNKINLNFDGLQIYFILCYSFLLIFYGLIIYLFRGGWGEFTDTSYIAGGFLMLTTLLYFDKELYCFGVKTFILLLRSLAFLMLIIAFFDIFSLQNSWFSIFTEHDVALISYREYENIRFPYIYFLASPMLIYLLGHELYLTLENKNIKNIFLFISASISFIFSGTRSHIIICLLYLPIFLLLTNFRKYYKYAILITIFILSLILLSGDLMSLLASFFDKNEASNSIKLNMISKYEEIFSDDISLIFGQGFNAHEWSNSLREMIVLEDGATKTELTYLEIFRVFGIFIGTVVIFSLFYLILQSSRMNDNLKWLYPGLVVFLINASLNPYLFSTNGLLPIALIIAILDKNRYSKKINI
jgi:hypothetical protein